MRDHISPPHLVCWRRLDVPGHEGMRITGSESGWRMEGTAVFVHHGTPAMLRYTVECDPWWRTVRGMVEGWLGDREVGFDVRCDDRLQWTVNGQTLAALAGCEDIDYGFSPSTNTIPIRRHRLAVGDSVAVRAAWLRFPQLAFEPLEQIYRRSGEHTYHYASAGGAFEAELEVDALGVVRRYGQLWVVEAE